MSVTQLRPVDGAQDEALKDEQPEASVETDEEAGEPTVSAAQLPEWDLDEPGIDEDPIEASKRGGLKTKLSVGAAALALLGVVGVTALDTLREPAPTAPAGPTIEDRVVSLESWRTEAVPVLLALQADLNAGTASLADVEESLTEALNGIGALSNVVDSDRSVSTRRAGLTAERQDAMAGQLGQLEERVTGIEARATRGLRGAARSRSVITLTPNGRLEGDAQARPSLPFQVVAIDQWGREAQLAVRQGNRLRTLGEGDTVAGWTYLSADRASRVATLQDPRGAQRRYGLERGFLDRPRPVGPESQLTVRTGDVPARVRVMNIVPVYEPGMKLGAGEYDVLVDAPGYRSHRQWVRIGAGGRYEYQVDLEATP